MAAPTPSPRTVATTDAAVDRRALVRGVVATAFAATASRARARETLENEFSPKTSTRAERFPTPGGNGAVRYPRPRVRVPFAVCALRSAYDAIDGCDAFAMDGFQARSWRFRASEWERYRDLYAPMRIEQGAIEDANYFDFASFVQFATLGRDIPGSTSVFEERVGAEGETKVVVRDEALRDNSKLPEAVARSTGRQMYERLLRGFDRGEDFEIVRFDGVPEPANRRFGKTSTELGRECVEGMRALGEVFVNNGYALQISVDNDLRRGTFVDDDGSLRVRVRVNGPATLWGARELAARGLVPTNEYLGFVMTAYLEKSGVGSSYSEILTETEIDMSWTLRTA